MTKKRILGCLRVPPVEYHWSIQQFRTFSHSKIPDVQSSEVDEELAPIKTEPLNFAC
jgi:hypothetical protein